MKKLGIIGAMSVEVEHLKSQLQGISHKGMAGMDFYEGILEGLPVVIVVCGVGKVNAALCAQALCDCFCVTHIVNTGIAGSLCAELDIGDFVISRDAMYHDFTCQGLNPAYKVGQIPDMPVHSFPADETLQALAMQAAEVVHPGHSRVGRIASGDQFVSDPALKDSIIHPKYRRSLHRDGRRCHCPRRLEERHSLCGDPCHLRQSRRLCPYGLPHL